MFFVRNSSVSLLLFAIVISGVIVLVSGKLFAEQTAQHAAAERGVALQAAGRALLGNRTVSSDEVKERAEPVISALAPERRGVVFVRLVDTSNRRILASTDPSEAGRLYKNAPPFVRDRVEMRRDETRRSDITMFTYLGAGGYGLWSAIDHAFFFQTAMVAAVWILLLLVAMFAVLWGAFRIIKIRYILRPLGNLEQALREINSKEIDGTQAKRRRAPAEIGVLLESFNNLARRIQATLKRDKLVSDMKSNFLTTTAHQLRTPLSGINWALGTLLSDNHSLSKEQRELVERSLEKNKELISIVGTLLNAASIEEGRVNYHFETASLRVQVERVVEEEQSMALREGVTLVFERPTEEPPQVNIDKERIQWVLRNLIENAIRYSNEGDTVVVRMSLEPRRLKVEVADSGIGISPQAQEHIFSKFFRAKEAVEKRDDGSGIGLYIAKSIVNGHGGEIWFESERGKGTTFYFTTPVRG